MDPASVNSFLDQFLAVADSGFGLIQGDVNYVLNALIVISITLAGAQWALAGEAPMAPFFRKVLFVGLFAFLVNNWASLSSIIVRSGAQLGLNAGGGSMTMAELHNPGRVGQIGIEMFGRTVALAEGMNFFTDTLTMLLIFIAALFVALGFFVLALQLFVSLIAFKLGALAAFVALPWGVFNGTAWVAERPLGWVAGCAIRLFVLALIASVSITFVETLPPQFVLDDGGGLQVLFFGLTVLALAWFAPQLASEVVSGQPHLSGSDAVRAGIGATFTTAGGAMLGGMIARPALKLTGAAFGAAGKAIAGRRPNSRGGGGGGGASGARPAQINYAGMQPKPASKSGGSP
ncbi:type IV secretion system protein [Terricaulis silvestris]|uniref:Conjugal transfer protein TrbL n=1 Tax=Terricaulis silvestris TaxID=2686094 RepID=A0A6I6MNP8_9CAUL|nr:type IV secretion system protein [Terricaulis silvestris]QGZ94956.1 conjugal transfer protein TrbL [Terricaulis silvestris]